MLDSELYEMGWNDLIGNLLRATECSQEEKRRWAARVTNNEIRLPRYDDDYVRGTTEAARAFLDGKELEFKGPEYVIADLKAKC